MPGCASKQYVLELETIQFTKNLFLLKAAHVTNFGYLTPTNFSLSQLKRNCIYEI